MRRFQILTKIARVAHVNRIPFATFHGGRNRFAADGRLDDFVHVSHGQAITRRYLAIRREIEEIAAGRALRKNTARIWKIG